MVKKILIIIMVLLMPSYAMSWTADTLICGPGDGTDGGPPSDDLSSEGQNIDSLFKAFRWRAGGSGDAYVFSGRVASLSSAPTSVSVDYAVYSDNPSGPRPDDLMMWGVTTGYNPNTIGIGRHYFDIQNVVTTRSIVSGNYYWLTMRISTGGEENNQLWWDRRGSDNMPDWIQKVGSDDGVVAGVYGSAPPDGSTYDWESPYGDNYYGWAIWTTSDSPSDPNVSSVSGTISHGGSITIRGSNFGSKSPAEPVLWDDGSDNTKLGTYYSESLPSSSNQGSTYNMQYRDSTFLSGRSVALPNTKTTYVLAGAHATNNYGYAEGNNVSLLVTPSSWSSGGGDQPKFYATYYYRIDPAFDDENNATYEDNMKELCISGDDNEIYGDGTWGYVSWCINTVPDSEYTSDDLNIGRHGVDCPELPYGCSGNNLVDTYNPVNSWVRMDWIGDYDTTEDNPTIELRMFKGDTGQTRIYQDHYGNALTTYETLYGCGYPSNTAYRSIGIGGFARTNRDNNGVNSFRYFSGIYVDTTHSRILLGDNQDFASCTIIEPQIPSGWDDDSITATVNLGALTGATAYLFVFDSDNTPSTGYEVTLGGDAPASISRATVSRGTIQ